MFYRINYAENHGLNFEAMAEWLDESHLEDIFNSHKVFLFGAFDRIEYTLDELKCSVKESKKSDFEKILFSQYFDEESFGNGAMLHPKWLIHDDIFQVVAHFFAASKAVSQLVKCEDIRMSFDVFCCVIPRKVVSLYDHNVTYEHSTGDLDEWLKMENVNILHHRKLKRNEKQLDLADCIQNHYRTMIAATDTLTDLWESTAMTVIVDRRNPEEQTLIIVESQNTDPFLQIFRNRMLGVQFSVSDKNGVHDGNVVRSWLYYGNAQRLRFWPEHLIWFIPHLFVKRARRKYTFIKRLYSDDYKRGFGVDLNDPHFNRYYKMLTGWPLHAIDVGYRELAELEAIKRQPHNSINFWCAFDWYKVADQKDMWVVKNRLNITRVLMEFEVDGFSIHRLRGYIFMRFVDCLAQRTDSNVADIKEPITNLVDALSQRMPMNMDHLIAAVAHEMTDSVAQQLANLDDDLYHLHPDSGHAIIHQFKTRVKWASVAEVKYLRSLFERMFHHHVTTPSTSGIS